MRCEDVVERLPEEGPEIAGHLAGCASCREQAEAYERDAELLALGLRAAAGEPALSAPVAARLSPPRRIVPLAAAAAMLVGILALLFFAPQRGGGPVPANNLGKPALLVIHGADEGELQMIPTDHVVWSQVVAVDENRLVAISADASDRLAVDQKLTLYRRIQGGYAEVGTLRLVEVGEAVARGRMADAKVEPRAGDVVVSGQPLSAAEKQGLLDYVLSFRLRGGNEANPYDRLVRGAGLEHDVEFLARLKDPRAVDRLARILGGVTPFAKEGLPAAGPDLAARMHEWWAQSKDRVRWNAAADQYEEIGK